MNPTLNIQRLNTTYLVSRELPGPAALRQRLDEVIENRLAARCGQIFSLSTDDPSVWLIQSLEIDLALDVGALGDDVIAGALAGQIAGGIARKLSAGADGLRVLHFPNRAAFLAQFVLDLIDGQAWDKWYYRSFENLRALPTSASVREALIREPRHTEGALLLIAERAGSAEALLGAVSEADAKKIFTTCAETYSGYDTPAETLKVVYALSRIWTATFARASFDRRERARNSLRLLLSFRKKYRDLRVSKSLSAAITHLIGFAEILVRAAQPEDLIAHLAFGDLAAACSMLKNEGLKSSLESLAFIMEISSGDKSFLNQISSALRAQTSADVSRRRESGAREFTTPFGGLFLLLPALMDLGLNELIEMSPYSELHDEGAGAILLRALLALKCLGRERADTALFDEALLLFSGLRASPSPAALHRFSESATAEMDDYCRRLFLEKLAGRNLFDGRSIFAELLREPYSDTDILLLRDAASDAWVYADVIVDGAQPQETLAKGIALTREASRTEPECILLAGGGLGERCGADVFESVTGTSRWRKLTTVAPADSAILNRSGDRPALWLRGGEEFPPEMKDSLERFLSRARPAAVDLSYLSLINHRPQFSDGRNFDLTWSLISRAVMTGFASRLMGFGWSSADYLFRNFMEGTSSVRVTGDALEVYLPPVPLQVVLNMAGVVGQSYTMPWLNNREVKLWLKAS